MTTIVDVVTLPGPQYKLRIRRSTRRNPSVNIILTADEVSWLISELWTATHGEEFDPDES